MGTVDQAVMKRVTIRCRSLSMMDQAQTRASPSVARHPSLLHAPLQRVDSIDGTVKFLSKQEAAPISLSQLYSLATPGELGRRHATFMQQDLPIRLAHLISHLRHLPLGLSQQLPIKQLARWYRDHVAYISQLGRNPDAAALSHILTNLSLGEQRLIASVGDGLATLPDVQWSQPEVALALCHLFST